MNCRVLPFERLPGLANMALDEALLDAVAVDPSFAYLRTYGWTEPTLSLGYFQSITEAEADPKWDGATVIRRPTGGGALWHHHELTYAVVVPGSHRLARPSTALYRAVHAAIAALLNEHGIPAGRRGTGDEIGEERPFLCFTDHDPEDIVSSGAKLVGSAQRRRSGAVLQHGALLLAGSPRTPELPGVSDLSRLPPDVSHWSELLNRRLPQHLGLAPVQSDVPAPIRARALELERDVYRSPEWTRRR